MDKIFLTLVLTLLLPSEALTSKILMVPVLAKSHFLAMSGIAKELSKRGHQIDMAISDNFGPPKDIENENLRFLLYKSRIDPNEANKMMTDVLINDKNNINKIMSTFENTIGQICQVILMENEEFVQQLEANKYDIVIMDAFLMTKCIYLIPHRLGLPIISVVDVIEPWLLRLPWIPSFVPAGMRGLSDKMSFTERLINTYDRVVMSLVSFGGKLTPDILEKYNAYGHIESIDDIVSKSQFWLYTSDPLLQHSFPLSPNVAEIGGLTTSPAKPLAADLSAKIDSFSNGFIVVSFGSQVTALRQEVTDMLLEAFGKLKIDIFWRFENKNNHPIPANVHPMKWLPQNDLLGHKSIRLFVSHCGKNGLYEALYHGVPVVAIPLFGDQPGNAKVLEEKKYGKSVDLATTSADELYSVINTVLQDTTFKDNIKRASAIFHSRPQTPSERAVYWVEHIIEYGGDYLRTGAYELRWYEYLMFDIALFIKITFVVVIYIMWKLFKCVIRCCQGKTKVKTN